MATWQSIMTNWHCGIMTLWQFLWTVRYFVCTWWNWNPMYILPLYTSKQNTYFENIWPHIYTHWSLTGQCWVNEMKLFHKKALFVSSLGVSLGSAALSLYWRKNVNLEDGDDKEHLSFHWHLFWLGSWIHWEQTLIFHLPKHCHATAWLEGCPKPSKPVSAVVIGGGIIGISTAVQLARRGVRVRVLEERPGEHSEPAQHSPH